MYFDDIFNTKEISDSLNKNGFAVIQNILDENLINDLNNAFDNEFINKAVESDTFGSAKFLPCASHSIKAFENLIINEKINIILKGLFSNKPYSYTSHSDMHLGISFGWHKDDGNGSYFEGLNDYFFSNECKVYKIGIYLRDATKSGGLTVKKGSHKFKDFKKGKNIYISTNIQDIIIFDVRLTHKGDRSLLHILKQKLGMNIVPYNRRSIFFTFGANIVYKKIFSEKNMLRQILQVGNKEISKMPETLKKKLNSLGINSYY